jgi:hypothetical protein
MKRLAMFPAVMLVAAILWPTPGHAQTQMGATGAGAGVFPPEVSFTEVSLNSLRFGMGITIADGAAEGQFQATLVGISAVGSQQSIEVEGEAGTGSLTASNTVTVAGTCTVDMGDGTLPLPGVPFTLVVAANADGSGSLTLRLGTTNLPAATVNEGHLTIK